MFRSTRRRLRRRLVVVAIAGAAVLVPSAQAVPVFETGDTQLRYGTPVGYLDRHAEATSVGADALGRFLANDRVHAAPSSVAGSAQPASGGGSGTSVDWTSLAIGLGTGFLAAAMLAAATVAARRGGIAGA